MSRSTHTRRLSVDEPRSADPPPNRYKSTSISSILNYPNGDLQDVPMVKPTSPAISQQGASTTYSPQPSVLQKTQSSSCTPTPQQPIILPPIVGNSSTGMHNSRSTCSEFPDSRGLSQQQLLHMDSITRRDSISLSPPPRLLHQDHLQPMPGSQILGPFWKVPYEMPGQSGQLPFGGNRRSSIDSMLSGVSFPSVRYLGGSVASDLAFESDSDDYYSVRLNSVSSRKLSIGSIEPPTQLTRSYGSNHSGQRSRGHSVGSLSNQSGIASSAMPFGGSSIHNFSTNPHPLPLGSVDSLENNIQKYYSSFHSSFPILYFDEARTYALVRNRPSLVKSSLCESLNLSLHCLIYFKQISLQEKIQVLLGIIAQYPFQGVAEDGCVALLFTSLLAVNYSIFLNGDHYLSGLTALMSMLHEFRILDRMQQACDAAKAKGEVPDCDDNVLLLPRHCFCLAILDGLYALQRGIDQSGNFSSGRMARMPLYMESLLPTNDQLSSHAARKLFQTHTYIQEALKQRDSFETQPLELSLAHISDEEDLASQFASLIGLKHQLINYLLNMDVTAKAIISNSLSEARIESLYDDITKLLRCLRLITLALKKSKAVLMSFSPNVYHPLFNISVGQLYKLTKVIGDIVRLVHQLCVICPNQSGHSFADFSARCENVKSELSHVEADPDLKQFAPWVGAVAFNTIMENASPRQVLSELNNSLPQSFDVTAEHWAHYILEQVLPFFKSEAYKGWL